MTQKLRSFLLFFLIPVSAAVGACDCASNPPTNGTDCTALPDGTTCDTGVCCGGSCEAAQASCPPGQECGGTPVCSSGTFTCTCVPLPPLEPGRLADDLDSTVTMDGTLVYAGYSPGDPELLIKAKWGDLVVGTYDGTSSIGWEIVDGVPSGGTIGGAVDGWRGGVTDPGDDVGRYAAIEANANDLAVAYADDTNGSLKWAARVGGTWSTGDIDAAAGAFVAWTSMALDSSGVPIVSYLVVSLPDTSIAQTQPQSSLRIARPDTALPVSGAWNWSHYEIDSGESGCTADLCADGFTCIVNNLCVIATADCATDCGADVCYNAVCYQKRKAWDYLFAEGQWTDIERTSTGFALVYYDRTTGNIYGRQCTGTCSQATDWQAAFVIDGRDGTRTVSNDCGIGASLFVDGSDVWHVTYVDGTAEELWYARLPGGSSPTYELIDDGSAGLTGLTRPQISYVGDDSSVVAADTAGGQEIRVAYADITLHTTVLATRAPGGGWAYQELATVPDTGEAGFSVTQCGAGGDLTYVGSEWVQMATDANGGIFDSNTDVFPNPAPVAPDGGV